MGYRAYEYREPGLICKMDYWNLDEPQNILAETAQSWNLECLISHAGKLEIIEREMEALNINILGLSETHWKGGGHFKSSSGNIIYFSGPKAESKNGANYVIEI